MIVEKNESKDEKKSFIGHCKINKSDIMGDIPSSDELFKKYSSTITAMGMYGELLPYRDIYQKWNDSGRLSTRIMTSSIIKISFVNVEEDEGDIKAQVSFSLKESRPKVNEDIRKRFVNLIKEEKINICFRPNLLTFDLYPVNYSPSTTYEKDGLCSAKNWMELIYRFSNNFTIRKGI